MTRAARPRPVPEALAEAGLAATVGSPETVVSVGTTSVAVSLEATRAGYRLTARVPRPAGSAELVGPRLVTAALHAPGDTAVDADAGGLVATRQVVAPAPGELRDAVHALAKLVAALGATAAVGADADAAAAGLAAAEPPAFPPLLDPIAAAFPAVTPSVDQPGWDGPDPSQPPAGQLVAGRAYQLVGRTGDWARVLTPDGVLLFSDGRRLLPAPSDEGDG